MKVKTLRGKVTLWSVSVVTAALVLFGAGAAWNLRDEMTENLGNEIKTEAHDFFKGVKEQGVDWRNPKSVEALFDQAKRFHYVEIHDASGRLLYRSPNLGNQNVFPKKPQKKLSECSWNGRVLRFGVFENGGIILALGKDTEETSETLAQLGSAYLFALPLVVIAVGIGSWWIAQRALAPVKAIAARAEKFPPPICTSGFLNLRRRKRCPSHPRVERHVRPAARELRGDHTLHVRCVARIEDAARSDARASRNGDASSGLAPRNASCSRI